MSKCKCIKQPSHDVLPTGYYLYRVGDNYDYNFRSIPDDSGKVFNYYEVQHGIDKIMKNTKGWYIFAPLQFEECFSIAEVRNEKIDDVLKIKIIKK